MVRDAWAEDMEDVHEEERRMREMSREGSCTAEQYQT